jgi:hypothetical protein
LVRRFEAIDREAHGVPQFWNGSGSDLSQEGFQLGEGHLDRVVMMTLQSGFLLRRETG